MRTIFLFLALVICLAIGSIVARGQTSSTVYLPLVFNEGIDILAGQSITVTATLTPTATITPIIATSDQPAARSNPAMTCANGRSARGPRMGE